MHAFSEYIASDNQEDLTQPHFTANENSVIGILKVEESLSLLDLGAN